MKSWRGLDKEFQAVLKRMEWKTKQIAQGDFKQRLNYDGEFFIIFTECTMGIASE